MRKSLIAAAVLAVGIMATVRFASGVPGKPSPADAAQDDSLSSPTARELPVPAPIDSTLTDFLAWVAGTSLADTTVGYRRYAEASVQTYAELRKTKLDSVAAFAEATLAEARAARTVLYPFAGGDVAYVTEFFPTADTIVLVGLEPVGRTFAWREWSPDQRLAFLSNLNRAVSTSNRIGYFLTSSMRDDFADASLNGVVHPIMLYLGWKGYAVVRLSHFDPADPRTDRPASDSSAGLRIHARHRTTNTDLMVEYVSADLSDDALARDSSMLGYLQQWEAPTVYLKAASYLLHFSNFSKVRRALGARARAVVQDDTGFPLQALSERFDSIAVYGSYTKPIEIFKNRYQPDLRARYSQPGIQRLGFRITYGGGSNMQYATRPKP